MSEIISNFKPTQNNIDSKLYEDIVDDTLKNTNRNDTEGSSSDDHYEVP